MSKDKKTQLNRDKKQSANKNPAPKAGKTSSPKAVPPRFAQTQKHSKANLRAARALLSHAAVVLSIMYAVFYFIDRVNNAMEFINNDITKALLLILAIISTINAEIYLYEQRRKRHKKWAEKGDTQRR